MGEALPLYLGIEYDLEKSTAADLPPVLLREVRIGYLIRQPLYTTDRITTIQSPAMRRYTHLVFENNNMIPITERMALHQSLPPDKLVMDELSFETPNIRRFYHDFFLAITVICTGKEFTASSRIEGCEFSFVPPAALPKGIELPGSRLLPPEAQSEAVYEMESRAAVKELQGEPLHELESNVRSDQLQGTTAVELPASLSAEVEAVLRPR